MGTGMRMEGGRIGWPVLTGLVAALTLWLGRPIPPPAPPTDFSRATIPLSELAVPATLDLMAIRDAIPPIDRPLFEPPASADRWLDPDEPVVAVVRWGDARAYPLRLLIRHEVVNDTVGGLPLVITY